MKKKHILPVLGIVLSGVIAVYSMLPLERAVHNASRWMEELPDEMPVSSLCIPGTHDSGALYSFAGVSGKCQSVSISEQLKMGVRFLDIRLKLVKNELRVVHSFVDQKLPLEDVLADVSSFIRENPSEFLLISFKEDDSPKQSDLPFSVRLEEMLAACGDIIAPDSTLPECLGDARGKIFILSRYDGASLGIPAYHGWQDNASFSLGNLYIQDHYAVSTVSDKQKDIAAAADSTGAHALTLNFTSCYLENGFPPLSAAVPARGIHPWLTEFLPSLTDCTGIFVCDFLTSALAAVITERNFQ